MKKLLGFLIVAHAATPAFAQFPERQSLTRVAANNAAKNQNRFSCGSNSCVPSSDCSSSSDCGSPCAPTPIFQSDFNFRSGPGEEIKARQTGFLLLTAEGIYCLAEEVTGSILIQGSSITLDLNGHTLNGFGSNDGIAISNPTANTVMNDVRIVNGLLAGIALTGTPGNGISSDGSVGLVLDVRIEDVTISEWNNGISFTNTAAILIERVISNLNTNDGLFMTTSIIGNNLISQSQFFGNSNAGVEVIAARILQFVDCLFTANDNGGLLLRLARYTDCLNCSAEVNNGTGFACEGARQSTFTNCHASTNSDFGFYATDAAGDAPSEDISYVGCTANDNDEGFLLDAASRRFVLKECVANNNDTGFHFTEEAREIMCSNCVAEFNDEGYLIDDSTNAVVITDSSALTNEIGFHGSDFAGSLTLANCISSHNEVVGFSIENLGAQPGANAILRLCTAQGNAATGFFQDASAVGQASYYSNIACYNTPNYSASILSVVGQDCANAFQNVDCSLPCV